MHPIKFLVSCYIDIDNEVNKDNDDCEDEDNCIDPRDTLKRFFFTIILLIILFKGEKSLFSYIIEFIKVLI